MKDSDLPRKQNRDLSDRIALGAAKYTTGAATFDSGLFDRATKTGFNEGQAYDRPLFTAHNSINSIYRLRITQDGPEEKASRAADLVVFEKETNEDPFNVDAIVEEVTEDPGSATKHGLEQGGYDAGKRARVL